MEDLPQKAQTSNPPVPAPDAVVEPDSAEARQEEARTIRYAVGKLNEFLQWFVVVLEVLLAIRFFLKLIGADPSNLFAGFVYVLTDIIMFPFVGIIPQGNNRFEWPVLIAMVIYWLLFWAIQRFLQILVSAPEEAPN